MLARYPKLDSGLANSTVVSLPPLCIQDTSSSWIPRSCDSAPVVLGGGVFFQDRHNSKPDPRTNHNMSAVSPEVDLNRLSRCVQLLNQSGYYYEGLSWQQAAAKLRSSRVGTFLVRDSENANYLFTLSVQTKRGPTSIRIAYRGAHFRLDSEDELVDRMPVFENVTDLVEYYVKVCRDLAPQKESSACCWLDLAGGCSAPVELYFPLYRRVNSLKHLCRLKIVNALKKDFVTNDVPLEKTLEKCHCLGLPVALKSYIEEYLHCH